MQTKETLIGALLKGSTLRWREPRLATSRPHEFQGRICWVLNK